MARQKGIIPLEGTIGNITFLKTRDGYLAKEKSSIPASRMYTDPAFARTRENWSEFGNAGKGAKLIRATFNQALRLVKDRRLTGNLVKMLVRVVQSDTVHERGQRRVSAGNLSLLEGFEFNSGSRLDQVLYAPYTVTVDRAEGEVSVSVSPFVPAQAVIAPGGTTHCRVIAAAAAVDFEAGSYSGSLDQSADVPYDQQPVTLPALSCNVPAESTLPLLVVFGVQFMQEVNGSMYPLQNGAFNALAVVKVDVDV